MNHTPDRNSPNRSAQSDRGTVLDRVKMPPMSSEEALRRFGEETADGGTADRSGQSELAQLHPVMRGVALVGTLGLIVGVLLGGLYLIGR